MSNDRVFTYGAQKVRCLLEAGEPWFALADACAAVGLINPTQVGNRVDAAERRSMAWPGLHRTMVFVRQRALCTIMQRSSKREAVPFTAWLTTQVVPSILSEAPISQPLAKSDPELIAVIAPLLDAVDRFLPDLSDSSKQALLNALSLAVFGLALPPG